MKIAVDAMGGDLAPVAPVRAVAQFALERSDVEIALCGDTSAITNVGVTLPKNVEIVHTESVIEGDDEPVKAVRRKRDSSMVVAANLVKQGQADTMISAGNTGAIVACGLLVIGRSAGIERPALSPILPTFNGRAVVLLDAGATMDCTPENLVQFAHMGAAYSEYILGVKNPRVGLLNVGSEESKGNALAKATFEELKKCDFNFQGNIEARELLDGNCDVVVCDGFVGNVVLKLAEGMGIGLLTTLKNVMMGSLKTKLAALMLKPSLRAFRNRFDYAEYGGAPFLGVSGGCIKAHGSSNERAWYTALKQGAKLSDERLVERISAMISK